jgi:branched-chain amino acid aminotransferase
MSKEDRTTMRSNQRIAYYNGQFIPEGDVRVPFRDRSFLYGDAGFDLTRTFQGRPFKVKEHMDRLYRSLEYLGIDPKLSPDEMTEITEEVLRRNLHLRDEDDDFWLGQRISRGLHAVGDEGWDQDGPTVIVECRPLPLRQRAAYFLDGIPVIVSSVRRVPPDSLSPRAKSHNYLNMIMANLEVEAQNPRAWALLLDSNGNLAEGMGSNIFLVRAGTLVTPPERIVLPGISRQTVMDLASDLGIVCQERDIDLFDAYNADECFLTSTSLCLCPVSTINGRGIGSRVVPGPVTARLTEAYSELVGCDIVAQYKKHLPREG